MFDKRAVAIAYYSAMGRYYLNMFIKEHSRESHDMLLFHVENLVNAIKG